MPKKSTSNLENELKSSDSLDQFLIENQEEQILDSLPVYLQELIDSKGLHRADVVKASNLNEVYAYQIISGTRRPSRDKLLAICFAMKASPEETQTLLKRNGFPPLYARNQRDSIILYALSHGKSVLEVNQMLYSHSETVLE